MQTFWADLIIKHYMHNSYVHLKKKKRKDGLCAAPLDLPITPGIATHAWTRAAEQGRERREGETQGGEEREDKSRVAHGLFLCGCSNVRSRSFFLQVSTRLKAPKTIQVSAEIYSDWFGHDSSKPGISGEEWRGVGSCRCTMRCLKIELS